MITEASGGPITLQSLRPLAPIVGTTTHKVNVTRAAHGVTPRGRGKRQRGAGGRDAHGTGGAAGGQTGPRAAAFSL
jgi:hypothetical protein